MSRLILVACLMVFFVPAGGLAETGVGKIKIGGGAGVTPDFGPAASVGFAVPGLNQGEFLALIEGTFEQYTQSQAGFVLFEPVSVKTTARFIGVNALGLYPHEKFHFFGGVGLVRWSGGARVSVGLEGVSQSTSGIEFNITAGAGMSFTELLFAEVRWSDQGADLVFTVGVKIQ